MTVKLTVVSMLVGVVLGTVLAVMRLSENPVLRDVAGGYIWLFRGTPIVVQLLFWFFLATVLPEISLGIPFGPDFAQLGHQHGDHAVHRRDPRARAERGGLHGRDRPGRHRLGRQGPDRGSGGARHGPATTYRGWCCPQAARLIVPPTANQTISMLKLTSLVLVIGLPDLTHDRAADLRPQPSSRSRC